MTEQITVLWLYPDILNLHGDRGNLMALERIGRLTGLPVELRRVDKLTDPLPLEQAALAGFLGAGAAVLLVFYLLPLGLYLGRRVF